MSPNSRQLFFIPHAQSHSANTLGRDKKLPGAAEKDF